jgi:hypothetical protein
MAKEVLGLALDPATEQLDADAACTVENATPVVCVKTLSHYNIAHELCHLRYRAKGFPSTITLDTARDTWFVSLVCRELLSIVEHVLIYPELLELGFDPHADVSSSVRNSPFGQVGPFPVDVESAQLVAVYVRVLLESSDEALKTHIRKRYKAHARREMLKARKLIKIIQKAELANLESFVRTVHLSIQSLGVRNTEYALLYHFPEHNVVPAERVS